MPLFGVWLGIPPETKFVISWPLVTGIRSCPSTNSVGGKWPRTVNWISIRVPLAISQMASTSSLEALIGRSRYGRKKEFGLQPLESVKTGSGRASKDALHICFLASTFHQCLNLFPQGEAKAKLCCCWLQRWYNYNVPVGFQHRSWIISRQIRLSRLYDRCYNSSKLANCLQ